MVITVIITSPTSMEGSGDDASIESEARRPSHIDEAHSIITTDSTNTEALTTPINLK